MLSADVQMLDLNPYHLRHLWDALFPARRRQLILILEGERVLKAFDTESGLRPDLRGMPAADPEGLAARLYAGSAIDQVLLLERQALDDYFVTAHRLYDPDLDGDAYLQRMRLALDDESRFVRFPPEPRGLHLAGVAYDTWVSLAGQAPDGQTVVLGVFDSGDLWASLILRLNAGQVTLVTTSDALEVAAIDPVAVPLGLTSPSGPCSPPATQVTALVQSTAERLGPVFAGLFMTRVALAGLLRAGDKLACLRELEASGAVILEPWPAIWSLR
jgi:hypothetical protein